MATRIDPDAYYSDEETSELLGTACSTLAHWRCNKTGPCYSKNGASRRSKIWYSGRDLLDWMASRRIVTEAA